jgi:AraC family transcriptional regulator
LARNNTLEGAHAHGPLNLVELLVKPMSIPLIGGGRIRVRGEVRPNAPTTRSWLDDRVTFDHRRWSCADAELEWTSPHHLFVLTEQGGTSRTEVRVGGQLACDGLDAPGALTFVPASADRQCCYRDADLFYSALWIDPAIQNRLSGCELASAPSPIVNGDDPVIGSLLVSLREDVVVGSEPGAAYIEHLVALLLMRLGRLAGASQPPQARGSRLNRKALKRVQDYVEDNIGTEIALSDLAGLTGLPVDAFARRFKATIGQAPYAYVIERRVRRAETLLGTTDVTIAAIAPALGFSSQSHLTTTFRRVTGTTPHTYRARFLS